MLFSNEIDPKRIQVVLKLNKIVEDKKMSQLIEKDIYNYIIILAKQKKISRNW